MTDQMINGDEFSIVNGGSSINKELDDIHIDTQLTSFQPEEIMQIQEVMLKDKALKELESDRKNNREKEARNEKDTVTISVLPMESLYDCCDKLSNTSTEIRITSLKTLLTTLQRNMITTCDYSETLLGGLERSIQKGKYEEQCLSIKVLTNFILQVGSTFVDQYKLKIKDILEPLFRDSSISLCVRQDAIKALSVTCFFVSNTDWSDCMSLMQYMETIFQDSYLTEDGSDPNGSTDMSRLHVTVLDCWALLFTVIPSNTIMDLVSPLLPILHQLLRSLDVDLRISSGSLLALIFERIRNDIDSQFKGNNYSSLITELESLAKDGSKCRSKIDRKKQRECFRDILTAFQSKTDSFPSQEIQFGHENMELSSWSDKCRYDVLCDVLGSGINVQLQQNTEIREIFGLDPPVIITKEELKHSKVSHRERNLSHQHNNKIRNETRAFDRKNRKDANEI